MLVSVLCGCVSAADMRKNNEFGSTNYRGKSCKRSVHMLSLVGDRSENDRSFNPNEPKIKIKPLVKCFRKFFFLALNDITKSGIPNMVISGPASKSKNISYLKMSFKNMNPFTCKPIFTHFHMFFVAFAPS